MYTKKKKNKKKLDLNEKNIHNTYSEILDIF